MTISHLRREHMHGTARVQLPPSYESSQSATSNEEFLFKKCEKLTTYCRAKYWSENPILMHL